MPARPPRPRFGCGVSCQAHNPAFWPTELIKNGSDHDVKTKKVKTKKKVKAKAKVDKKSKGKGKK